MPGFLARTKELAVARVDTARAGAADELRRVLRSRLPVRLIVVRPLALLLSLHGSELDFREKITAGWFGPKGFASVIYGLLLYQAATPGADRLFHLVAIVVVGSMVAHSSTDVLFARWFCEKKSAPVPKPSP